MTQRQEEICQKEFSRPDHPAADDARQATKGEVKFSPVAVPAWTRSDGIFLSLIVLVAALLRFVNLNYMEFKGDEADNLFTAIGLVSGKTFPLVGIPSSIGTLNPPLFTYLMAIPLLFSRNPVIAAGFVALLNCVAVGLCYVFCRRYFGQIVAVIAAVFFAVNPWAVFYSRKIWQQDLLPLFVIGFFFALFAVVCEGRKRHILTCFACLAATTQLHLSSVYFLVVLAAALVWFRPKIGWRIYLGGIAILLGSYAPYLVFELLHDGYNTKIYRHAFSLPSHFRSVAMIDPFAFATTLGFMHFENWPPLDVLQALLLAMGLVYVFFRRRDARYGILLLWFCVPLVFLLRSKLDLYPHYFICFYPVQFVVTATMANALIEDRHSSSRILLYATPALLIAMAAYQASSSIKFVSAIAQQEQLAWPGHGFDYGSPFRFRVQEIRELSREGIVEPARVQSTLLREQPSAVVAKYDYSATKYIVENLNSLP